jgi:hypothetical protein
MFDTPLDPCELDQVADRVSAEMLQAANSKSWPEAGRQTRTALPEAALRRDRASIDTAASRTRPVTISILCTS